LNLRLENRFTVSLWHWISYSICDSGLQNSNSRSYSPWYSWLYSRTENDEARRVGGGDP
jgi:hypothetical protein